MTLKTVVWNMEHNVKNWRVLRERSDLKDADISLLCEAPTAFIQWAGHEREIRQLREEIEALCPWNSLPGSGRAAPARSPYPAR